MQSINLLVDELPETVEIDGQEYEINTDFRVGILFETMMQDRTLSTEERVLLALNLYYPNPPENVVQAFLNILWFYKCGKEKMEEIVKGDDDTEGGEEGAKIAYSFEHDDAYIYAAFLQKYGIDLTTTDMHWWKFRALFRALPDDTPIIKIMGYRVAKITDKMSKGEKAYLRKMKKIYRLPLSEAEQEYNSKLIEALENGGDLTGLL